MTKTIGKVKETKAQLKERIVAALKPRLAQIEEDTYQRYGGPGMTRADVRRAMIIAAKIVAKAAKLGINPMELWMGQRK
jgi:hypothetical protein